jgi:hypothetical protein
MLQRKQSIWLLVAALLNACVLFFDLYQWHDTVNGIANAKFEMRVTNEFPLLLAILVCAILPLVAMFMFKQRKRQLAMSAVTIVAVFGFSALMLAKVSEKTKAIPAALSNGTYWIGAVLPILSILFLVLAMIGIRKDDKLVKSMDRLR